MSSRRDALEHEAADLAVTIAARLLERLPVRVLNQAFLEGIAEVLATHSSRASLSGSPVEVRSAAPLDAPSRTDCEAILARLVGRVPQLTFRTDPTLIAGVEFAFPDVVVRNSWQSDLARITASLQEESRHDIATQRLA